VGKRDKRRDKRKMKGIKTSVQREIKCKNMERDRLGIRAQREIEGYGHRDKWS
jgi:hypothetical protein